MQPGWLAVMYRPAECRNVVPVRPTCCRLGRRDCFLISDPARDSVNHLCISIRHAARCRALMPACEGPRLDRACARVASWVHVTNLELLFAPDTVSPGSPLDISHHHDVAVTDKAELRTGPSRYQNNPSEAREKEQFG
jgi:hypothetical protein